MKNSKEYCLISVRNCFVIEVLYHLLSLRIAVGEERCGYGMARVCFIDVVLHGSKNYHQKNATDPRRLPKDVADAILRFQHLRNGLPSLNVAVPALKMIHVKDVKKVQQHQKSLNKCTIWYWMTG
jgi:hypothetical protein